MFQMYMKIENEKAKHYRIIPILFWVQYMIKLHEVTS